MIVDESIVGMPLAILLGMDMHQAIIRDQILESGNPPVRNRNDDQLIKRGNKSTIFQNNNTQIDPYRPVNLAPRVVSSSMVLRV